MYIYIYIGITAGSGVNFKGCTCTCDPLKIEIMYDVCVYTFPCILVFCLTRVYILRVLPV